MATFGIFVFHFRGLERLQTYKIDFFSILAFCFITGYFSNSVDQSPYRWIITRILSILVPYWIVIIPVLIINKIIVYKRTSIFEDLITFFGGNLFLNDPVYVIGWYITFILIVYFFIFSLSIIDNYIHKLILHIFWFVIFFIFLEKEYYYLSVLIGIFSQQNYNFNIKNINIYNVFLKFIFYLSSGCYSFFLVHGGILLFLVNYFKVKGSFLFISSLLLTLLSSFFVKFLSQYILINIKNRLFV